MSNIKIIKFTVMLGSIYAVDYFEDNLKREV